METLGERLQYLLKKKNIKARTLAKGIGLPETTISNILHDKFEPGVYKVKKIAEFLNADLHWLITGMVNHSSSSLNMNIEDPPPTVLQVEDPGQIFNEEYLKELKKLDPEYQRIILGLLKSINELTHALK